MCKSQVAASDKYHPASTKRVKFIYLTQTKSRVWQNEPLKADFPEKQNNRCCCVKVQIRDVTGQEPLRASNTG